MTHRALRRLLSVLVTFSAATAAFSCVEADDQLGKNFISTTQLYEINTVEIDLEDIRLQMADNLSGYSDSKVTVGAIREDTYGLTKRSCALTLVPVLDTLDFGEDPVVTRFYLHLQHDTVSVASADQEHILQNFNVYELSKPLDLEKTGTNQVIEYGTERVNAATVVYNGTDSLHIEFKKEFGQKYLEGARSVLGEKNAIDTAITKRHEQFTAFQEKCPGICIVCDDPNGNGGRINMFSLSVLSVVQGVYSSYYERNDNVAVLKLNAKYNGVRKDTSFLFVPGEPDFIDEASFLENNQKFSQYAFNATIHETKALEGKAGEKIFVEGGGGLKPVVQAAEMRDKMIAELSPKGNPEAAIICKATLRLPFEEPEDYLDLDLFPKILSPTCQIVGEERTTFSGLTDSSSETENQGDINRSILVYQPDITHHLQEILKLKDEDLAAEPDKIHNYDVWFLTLNKEKSESSASSSAANEYLQQLMYSQYYNMMYGGYGGYGYGYGGYPYYGGYGGYPYYGYGGYGGYGYGDYYGYGYGSNYLNYMMLSGMGSSSDSSETVVLDKDRFYRATLNGPTSSSSRKPKLVVTYAIPKE